MPEQFGHMCVSVRKLVESKEATPYHWVGALAPVLCSCSEEINVLIFYH